MRDAGDPGNAASPGYTPKPSGANAHDAPPRIYQVQNSVTQDAGSTGSFPAFDDRPGSKALPEETVSGTAPLVGTGAASVVRIPVPGTNGLFIEFTPRFSGNWRPKGGVTSTVFIQDSQGKRFLRLDYGPNKSTGGVDYHWNQKGTFGDFGIADHTPAGRAGAALYEFSRYFKWGGRVLLVAGAAIDIYSIVIAKRRWYQATRVAAGWGGAWAGCEIAGAWGAGGGSIEPGLGNIIGGVGGCIVGGIAGYAGASWIAGKAYDWVEEIYYERLPEVQGR